MIAICLIVAVVDADTVTGLCEGRRERIRLAAISALESDGSCSSAPWCATMPFLQAKAIAEREMLGRTITFRIVGVSGKRLVGDNRAVRCRLTRSGAAVRWPAYERRYGLRACG